MPSDSEEVEDKKYEYYEYDDVATISSHSEVVSRGARQGEELLYNLLSFSSVQSQNSSWRRKFNFSCAKYCNFVPD